MPEADLQLRWDFGDGTPAAYGRTVRHVYKQPAVYRSTLTVTNRSSGASDTMVLPITVVADDAGSETDPDGQHADPGARPAGSIVACQGSQLGDVRVTRSGRGLKIDATGKALRVEVLRVGARKDRKVADFAVNGSGRFDGKGTSARGTYVLRLSTRGTGSRPDSIALAFQRRGGRLVARRPFQRLDSCDGVSVFRLSAPTFGRRALGIAFSLTKPGRAQIDVYRGGKRVRRFTPRAAANRLVKIGLSGRGLRKGEYRVVLRAASKALTLHTRRAG